MEKPENRLDYRNMASDADTDDDFDVGDDADFDPAVFRSQIRRFISSNRINQSKLAESAGVPRAMVSAILKNRTKQPRFEALQRLADAMNMDVADLGRRPAPRKDKSVAVLLDGPRRQITHDLPKSAPIGNLVPIVGVLEDGAFRAIPPVTDVSAMRQIIAARDPHFENHVHFGFEIADDSMALAGINRGDVVICVDFLAIGIKLKSGMIVVTERVFGDGRHKERALKAVEVLSDQILLVPRSANNMHKPIAFRDEIASEPEGVRIVALAVSAIKRLYRP